MSHLPSSAETAAGFSALICSALGLTLFPSFLSKKRYMTIRPTKSGHPVDRQSVIGRFCSSSALIAVYIWFSFNIDTLGQSTARIH